MKNKIILNNSIPSSIFPSHNNQHIKLATLIYPIPTSTIPSPILHSTTSINNNLKKQTSNIITYIATTYSSKKSKQKYTTKLKKQVDTLNTNLLITSIPRTTSSTNPTTNDHNCTPLHLNHPSNNHLFLYRTIPPRIVYSYNIPIPMLITTKQKILNNNSTQNSTAHVDNKLIHSNRKYHPLRIKPFTRYV